MPFIHINDVVKAISFIAQNNNLENGPINLISPKSCTNIALLKQLHYFQWLPKWPLSKKILKVLVGESSVVFTDSKNIKPQRLQNAGFEFDFPEINQAINGYR